jgi:hypothetical protein
VPLYGWAPFVGDIDLVNREVISYKLVSVDAYGGRHVITKSAKNWLALFWHMNSQGFDLLMRD